MSIIQVHNRITVIHYTLVFKPVSLLSSDSYCASNIKPSPSGLPVWQVSVNNVALHLSINVFRLQHNTLYCCIAFLVQQYNDYDCSYIALHTIMCRGVSFPLLFSPSWPQGVVSNKEFSPDDYNHEYVFALSAFTILLSQSTITFNCCHSYQEIVFTQSWLYSCRHMYLISSVVRNG